MGTESVPETLENFYALMQLSAREDFGEFFLPQKLQEIQLFIIPVFLLSDESQFSCDREQAY